METGTVSGNGNDQWKMSTVVEVTGHIMLAHMCYFPVLHTHSAVSNITNI